MGLTLGVSGGMRQPTVGGSIFQAGFLNDGKAEESRCTREQAYVYPYLAALDCGCDVSSCLKFLP